MGTACRSNNRPQGQTVDHRRLQAWIDQNGLSWADLARVAGVSGGALSIRKNSNRPFESDHILAWKNHYNWPGDLTAYLCYNGEEPVDPEAEARKKTKRILQLICEEL